MKICHLTTSFPRFEGDASSLFVYEQAKRLSGKHDITVVVPMDSKTKKRETMDGVKVERFSYFFNPFQTVAYGSGIANNMRHLSTMLVFPFFMMFFITKALAVSRKSDLIHAHWIVSGFVALLIKKTTGKPYVITVYRSVWKNPISRFLNRIVLENADHVIFISNFVKNQSLSIAELKHYSVIPLGTDEDRFKPGVKGRMKKELGIKGKVVLSVGRLVEKKGFVYLIEAMKDLNVTLVLVGRGEDREKLEKKAETLGIRDRVKFVTHVRNEDLPGYMADADVFVLPSIVDSKGEVETQGVVLVEASSCGIPVVGSRVGGIIDVIDDGKTGFLVKEKDVKELADKISILLKDKDKRNRFGKSGRRRVLEKFTWASSIESIENVYRRLV